MKLNERCNIVRRQKGPFRELSIELTPELSPAQKSWTDGWTMVETRKTVSVQM